MLHTYIMGSWVVAFYMYGGGVVELSGGDGGAQKTAPRRRGGETLRVTLRPELAREI